MLSYVHFKSLILKMVSSVFQSNTDNQFSWLANRRKITLNESSFKYFTLTIPEAPHHYLVAFLWFLWEKMNLASNSSLTVMTHVSSQAHKTFTAWQKRKS